MAMPSAPQASAAARPRPSRKPPAATTGTLCPTASSTWGSRMVVGTVPVWPPPSPPCTVTASAPSSTAFTACFTRPTVGMQTTPAYFSRRISSGPGERE